MGAPNADRRDRADDGGEFYLQADPGRCEAHMELGSNMARALGPSVEVEVVADQVTEGVRLAAPQLPAWRDATPEESAAGDASLCAYWTASHKWDIAMLEQWRDGAPSDQAKAALSEHLHS